MSERLKEPVSKTGVPLRGTAGSNPALSVEVAYLWAGGMRARLMRSIGTQFDKLTAGGFDTSEAGAPIGNPSL